MNIGIARFTYVLLQIVYIVQVDSPTPFKWRLETKWLLIYYWFSSILQSWTPKYGYNLFNCISTFYLTSLAFATKVREHFKREKYQLNLQKSFTN